MLLTFTCNQPGLTIVNILFTKTLNIEYRHTHWFSLFSFFCYIHVLLVYGSKKNLDYTISCSNHIIYTACLHLVAKLSICLILTCTSGKTVHLYTKETGLKLYHTFKDHDQDVTALVISPDESLLVTTDRGSDLIWGKDDSIIMVFDINGKQKKFKIDNSLMQVSKISVITKANLLICPRSKAEERETVVIFDLNANTVKHNVIVNKNYGVEGLPLHHSHDYVLTDFRSTSVINGIRDKYAQLINIQKGTIVSTGFWRDCVRNSGKKKFLNPFTRYGKDVVALEHIRRLFRYTCFDFNASNILKDTNRERFVFSINKRIMITPSFTILMMSICPSVCLSV